MSKRTSCVRCSRCSALAKWAPTKLQSGPIRRKRQLHCNCTASRRVGMRCWVVTSALATPKTSQISCAIAQLCMYPFRSCAAKSRNLVVCCQPLQAPKNHKPFSMGQASVQTHILSGMQRRCCSCNLKPEKEPSCVLNPFTSAPRQMHSFPLEHTACTNTACSSKRSSTPCCIYIITRIITNLAV